jgi:hypothetical protein
MIRGFLTIGVAVTALALFHATVPPARAGEPVEEAEPVEESVRSTSSDAGSEGVLLVRGGGVLEGTITRVDDRYHVARTGVELDVAADRVTLVCSTLEEAYLRQREQLPLDSAEAHLGLAEWCLRYDLVSQAEQELADVRRLDPRLPKLSLVERSLQSATLSAAVRVHSTAQNERHRERATDEMRKLEAAVADLPPGVVERFARKVQPLLVNNCTTTGCHQPTGEQEFQLDRAIVHGLSNRRTTLRNLTAALQLVDRNRPHASPLLAIPRQSHGGMRRPIFGPRQEDQLRQLTDWVAQITDAAIAEPLATATAEQASFAEENRPRPVTSAVRRAAFETEAPTLRPKQPLRVGVEIRPWQPKDPFDPAIFHRQIRATTDASAAETTTAESESTSRR